jgi:nucleotide-binding universal stress UspA family protein
MFKKVLLDLGASVDVQLISQAVDFCTRVEAKLTILNVFEEPSPSVASYFSSQHKDLRKVILESYEDMVSKEIGKLDFDWSSFDKEIRWGKDFIETIKAVREGNFDLVISASQNLEGPPDSTAMHLMRKCPCPVWIHRGKLWKGAVRILAAINTSDTAAENQKLNKKILEHGLILNEALRGHFHIVTCWSAYMESVLTSPRFTETEKVNYLNFEEKQTQQALASISEELDLPDAVKAKIIHGNPASIIPRYAAEQKMDIVVMGSVARTGIPGLLIGNTAEKIMSNLENSIVAIKPDGFESPVK